MYAAGSNDNGMEVENVLPKTPFHKWVQGLHRRHIRRQKPTATDEELPWQEAIIGIDETCSNVSSGHYHSSTESSFAFVSGTRSASVSLASVSVLGRSRRNLKRSFRGHSRTDRSSRASISGPRLSDGGYILEPPIVMDAAVADRALHRRRILEELINTEEGYIGDMKFLVHVSLEAH
jgi:hypothetical protein